LEKINAILKIRVMLKRLQKGIGLYKKIEIRKGVKL